MKNILTKKVTLLLAALVFSLPLIAQTAEQSRMNRDIRIMENILDELFKVKPVSPSGKSVSSVYLSVPGGRQSQIKGTYLPDYGLIFTIPGRNSNLPVNISINRDGEGANYSFFYNADGSENDRQVDEESVKARIKEFLMDYAPSINHLQPDEEILVIYGAGGNYGFGLEAIATLRARSGSEDADKKTKELPIISVTASKNNLDAYRKGDINAKTFEDRLNISTTEQKEYLDLKVMKNIFETALDENDAKSFKPSGPISYLKLNNFGALFSMKVRYYDNESGRSFFVNTLGNGNVRVTKNGVEEIIIRKVDEEEKDGDRDSAKREEAREKEREEYRQNIENAYQKLRSDLKEYLVDYGRTLKSVGDEQYILVSVTFSSTWNQADIPERIDVQVKKSVLEQVDSGKMSRNDALGQIRITEYR